MYFWQMHSGCFNPGPLNVGIAYGAGELDGDSGANSNTHVGVTYSCRRFNSDG